MNRLTFRSALLPACLLFLASLTGTATAEETETKLSDEEKLSLIFEGKDTFTRTERIRKFAREGEIDAVGRLVAIDKKVYFKTADQSYIPKDKRFPYPELFLELHLSESHAYTPLIDQGFTKRHRILYDGPLRIRGNWAYEGAFHIFGVVWVDEASKVAESPKGDWGPWLKKRHALGKSKNTYND